MNRNRVKIELEIHPSIGLLMVMVLNGNPIEVKQKGYENMHNIAQEITNQICTHLETHGIPDYNSPIDFVGEDNK